MSENRSWSCRIGYATDEEMADLFVDDKVFRTWLSDGWYSVFGRRYHFCESGWGSEQPKLGLATTEQLIDELAARIATGEFNKLMDYRIRIIKAALTPEQLAYKTVDS